MLSFHVVQDSSKINQVQDSWAEKLTNVTKESLKAFVERLRYDWTRVSKLFQSGELLRWFFSLFFSRSSDDAILFEGRKIKCTRVSENCRPNFCSNHLERTYLSRFSKLSEVNLQLLDGIVPLSTSL